MSDIKGLDKKQLKFLGRENDKARVAALSAEGIRVVGMVLENPAFWIVAGVTLLEYFERKGWGGSVITTAAEVGLITAAGARALGPVLPQLGEAVGSVVGGIVGKVVPG